MPAKNNTSLIMYTTQDGLTKIQATFDNDTVWLSLDQIAELFQRDKSTISRHIKNIFEEGELEENRTVANFATVQNEGERQVERIIEYFNLDVIISVGYRVKSLRGTQFRIWAMQILKEYMQKGFALDDDRLKELVSAYLDVAEVMALDQKPMYMKDWLSTIDDYLKMTRREILPTAGKISHKLALKKAHEEYFKYKQKEDEKLSQVEKHFLEYINQLDKTTHQGEN